MTKLHLHMFLLKVSLQPLLLPPSPQHPPQLSVLHVSPVWHGFWWVWYRKLNNKPLVRMSSPSPVWQWASFFPWATRHASVSTGETSPKTFSTFTKSYWPPLYPIIHHYLILREAPTDISAIPPSFSNGKCFKWDGYGRVGDLLMMGCCQAIPKVPWTWITTFSYPRLLATALKIWPLRPARTSWFQWQFTWNQLWRRTQIENQWKKLDK